MVFAFVLLLVVIRAPELLARPRLWAEEGTVYFRFAREHGAGAMVSFFYERAGYLHLVMNLVAAAGRSLSLESWAWVSTYAALALTVTPGALVCFGKSAFWTSGPRKLAAVCVLYLSPTITCEVWLNSLNAQVWCGLTAFCILVEDWSRLGRVGIAWRGALLVLCILTGPYAAVLAPFLAFAGLTGGWRSRSWRRMALGGVSLASLLLHVWLIAWHGGGTNTKRVWPGIEMLQQLPETVMVQLVRPLSVGHQQAAALAAGLLLALAVLGLRRREELLGLAAGTTAMIATTALAMGGAVGGRYAVVPSIVVYATLVGSCLRVEASLWRRAVGILLLAMIVGAGLLRFRTGDYWGYAEGTTSWSQEVARWRVEPTHQLRLWPQDGAVWVITIE